MCRLQLAVGRGRGAVRVSDIPGEDPPPDRLLRRHRRGPPAPARGGRRRLQGGVQRRRGPGTVARRHGLAPQNMSVTVAQLRTK